MPKARALSAPAKALLGRLSSPAAGRGLYAVVDPARPFAEPIAHVRDCTEADTIAAIDAASEALPAWSRRTAGDRANILHTWYGLIMDRSEELAQLMTLESGKALSEARKEVAYGAGFVRWFAEEARRVKGEILAAPTPDRRLLVLRQPVGVIGAITPWNFPNAMITRKVAPALAAGCTAVVKPAEATPLSALALAELAAEAGVPPGVIGVVPCSRDGAKAVGGALCADSRVRLLSFTGSTAVGKLLLSQCAPTVKKMGLELGGNAPFVIFDDADLDVAVRALVASKVRNAGQACVATNRVLVQSGVYDALSARVAEALAAERVGHGLDEGVTMGPLINVAGLDKFHTHIDDALSRGGKLRFGGPDHEPVAALRSDGAPFAAPTLIENTGPGMRCWDDETFAPLVALTKFETEEEALELANDSEVGLAGYFCTQDMRRAWRFAEALEVGMIGVNEGIISTEVAPFGGIKESGLGREGHQAGMEEYLEIKYICMGNM